AERHDLLVAAISHLPYLIACNLVRSAEIIALNDAELWDVASSGFRDTTRLAASNVEMSLDILLTNKDRILDMTRMFQEQLASFISLLENNDEDMLRDYLSSVQNIRKHLFVSSPT
ncbi:MAG: prephenate dehydrogenase dimerization domain-containing protein, partial [Chloroflexota bacterium]